MSTFTEKAANVLSQMLEFFSDNWKMAGVLFGIMILVAIFLTLMAYRYKDSVNFWKIIMGSVTAVMVVGLVFLFLYSLHHGKFDSWIL